MSNSASNQDSCICMHASAGPPNTTQQNHDQFTFEISISQGALSKNPIRKTSPRIHQTTNKTFHYPRAAFLSDKQIYHIIRNIIQGLETPFALENIHWGLNFPTGQTPENLDDIISNRLSGIARRCAGVGCMTIRIRKLEKLEQDKYQELCMQSHDHLDDWILENQGDVELNRCLGFIYELRRKDDKFYGLKSVKVESSEVSLCSICIKTLQKNSQAIRMACSHMFHGFCIFKWLQTTPTCPLCRSHLFTSTNL